MLALVVCSRAVADDNAVTYIEVLKRGAPIEETITGSGFLIDDLGHIITALHVIAAAGAEDEVNITVRFGTREASPFRAQIVDCGDGNIDICLLRVTNVPTSPKPEPFKPLCRPLLPQEHVTVMGFPPGELNPLVTRGGEVSSNVGAQLKYTVTADLDPGMSGGPVVDADGFVVGLNTGVSGDSTFIQPLSYGVDIVLKTGINCLHDDAPKAEAVAVADTVPVVCRDGSWIFDPTGILASIKSEIAIPPEKIEADYGCGIAKLSVTPLFDGYIVPYHVRYQSNGNAMIAFDRNEVVVKFYSWAQDNMIDVNSATVLDALKRHMASLEFSFAQTPLN